MTRWSYRLFLLPFTALALWGFLTACASYPTPTPIDVRTLKEIPQPDYIYLVTAGDQIKVEIEDDDYKLDTTVLPDGRATFRYVGELEVMGLTLGQTRELLSRSLVEKGYYTRPRINLQLTRTNGPDPIVFLGNWGGGSGGNQASTGKAVPWRKGLGVTEAIALMGGSGEPDVDIAPAIFVVRNIKSQNRIVYRYELAAAVRGGSPDLPLFPGDVVFTDQSWLQDLSRALGVAGQIIGSAGNIAGTAFFIDRVTGGG